MPDTVYPLLWKCILIYLLGINLIAAATAAIDKRRARRSAWRIPEKTLLLLGAFGGATGELTTMLLVRHKTKHLKFMILLPLFIIVHAVLLILFCFRFMF